ncbi:MAG: nitrogen regulation protein NR(II) [Xanthobacteraceae bacterium]
MVEPSTDRDAKRAKSAAFTRGSPFRLPLAAVAALALTAVIFAVDTFTPLGFAVAVLYALIVMMVASFLDRRGILIVAGICISLTLIAFFTTHHFREAGPLARAAVSISAIVIATVLTVKNKEFTDALAAQAALLDLTHDAIFTRTQDDVITYWNRGAELLYGWDSREAMGRHASELLESESSVAWKEAHAILVATGRWEGEMQTVRRDGEHVQVSCRWSLERDSRGVPLAVLETHSDITGRVQTELALDRAKNELVHISRVTALGELTASIAHEINQPLAAVTASGEACLRWLRRDVPDLNEATSSVERMIAAARRASEVVARLRALARQSNADYSRLEIDPMIEEILPLVRREVAAHNVDLEVDAASGAMILGDRVQLQQVLINLIVNGIQAMEGNGTRPREMRIATSRVASDDGGNSVLITVSDTGSGFSAEIEQKLFSAFFTTKPQGMGIGLSLCRRIIEAHNGRIWPTRREPTGATFNVSLPLQEEASS